jgi:SM-20-related protein
VSLSLHPSIDPSALARRFAGNGRVRIQPFLSEAAAAEIHAAMAARTDWRQVINSGDKVFELDRSVRAQMTAEQRAALEQAVANGARDGFQYRYESIRLPDGDLLPAGGSDPAGGLTHWLSQGAPRELLRAITGYPDIAFADGQLTAYSAGDFLTAHDDAVSGKHRRAAYVLGLTKLWRVDWGGLLQFHDPDQAVSALMPSFNSLDLFAVPQVHSVSMVVPAATVPRDSITGWLRASAEAAGGSR